MPRRLGADPEFRDDGFESPEGRAKIIPPLDQGVRFVDGDTR